MDGVAEGDGVTQEGDRDAEGTEPGAGSAPLGTAGDLRSERSHDVGGRKLLYASTTLALTLVIGLAFTDAVGVTSTYGVRTRQVSVEGNGVELRVRYGAVTRPSLATPLEMTVARPGGLPGEVTLAVDRRYLALWDINGLSPAPASETASDAAVEWTFTSSGADELVVTFDARLEPGVQRGRTGWVEADIGNGRVAAVEFTTRVMP